MSTTTVQPLPTLDCQLTETVDFHPTSSVSATAGASAVTVQRLQTAKDRTVTVFDWDDTLCPSSWLQSLNILPLSHDGPKKLPSDVALKLNRLSRRICKLLEKAEGFGPVFIVTAAERGWVELSCQMFLPKVWQHLSRENTHIVSARTWYENRFGTSGDCQMWKDGVMQIIAKECFTSECAKAVDPSLGYFNLISIGDSLAERNACHAAAQETQYTLAKTIKFIEKPHIRQVNKQLGIALNSFEELCCIDISADIRLTLRD